MTLRISAPTSPSDATFQRLLDAIPEGHQWVRGNIIPYSELDGIPVLLEADPGSSVDIFVNGRLNVSMSVSNPKTLVRLQMELKQSTVTVKSGLNTFQTLLVPAEHAIYLRAFADETFAQVERDIVTFEQELRSYFSIRLTEHRMLFQDLLPASTAYRTLLGKMAIRALINESAETRGIDDIVTAVTVSTPYVTEQIASTDPNLPILWSDAQDFGGNTVHVWLPNTCLATWYGFVRLLDTFADSESLVTLSATDERIVVYNEGQKTEHVFDTTAQECFDLVDPCEDDSYIWVRITSLLQIALCAWSTSFDASVDLPLGRRRFDSGIELDSGEEFDSIDETAPMDGWVGVSLSRRFDQPTCLDSSVGGSSAVTLEELCCNQPADGLLVESLTTFDVPIISYIGASLIVLPA